MNKTLNLIVMMFGIMLIIGGILKNMNLFTDIKLSVGNASLIIPNATSSFSIIAVNIIGGLSFLFHGMMTLKYKDSIMFQPGNNEIDSNLVPSDIRMLTKVELTSGFLTMAISCWLILRTFVLLTAFEGNIIEMLPLFVMSLLCFGVFSILPIMLVGKNLSLNNKIGKIIDERLSAEKRRMIQEKKKTLGVTK